MQAVVVLLLVLARVASADVGVVVSGDPNMQASVLNHAQRWVQMKKHALVAAPLGTATDALVDCFVMEDMACARKVFDAHAKADTVVFMRIDMQAEPRSYLLNAYWFVHGKEPVHDKRACAPCDDTALNAIVDSLMSSVATTATGGNGIIKVAGGSPGLVVKVDGNELGGAPLEREVSAGSHEIVFVHRGTPVDVRRVEVEAGAVLSITAPRPAEDSQPTHRRRSRVLPALLLIGGAAAAIAGGTLLYYGSLSGPDEPYVYTNATKIGLPLALAGAFVLGAGTTLMFSSSSSATTVGVARSF